MTSLVGRVLFRVFWKKVFLCISSLDLLSSSLHMSLLSFESLFFFFFFAHLLLLSRSFFSSYYRWIPLLSSLASRSGLHRRELGYCSLERGRGQRESHWELKSSKHCDYWLTGGQRPWPETGPHHISFAKRVFSLFSFLFSLFSFLFSLFSFALDRERFRSSERREKEKNTGNPLLLVNVLPSRIALVFALLRRCRQAKKRKTRESSIISLLGSLSL